MGAFILTTEERLAGSVSDWSDDTLGKAAMNAAIMFCEFPDGSVDANRGLEKAPAVLCKLTCEVFGDISHAFSISLLDDLNNVITYCISVDPAKYKDESTIFSALIDGERIKTNDASVFIEYIENADTITEVTIKYGKNS